jgi:hypothetical protein
LEEMPMTCLKAILALVWRDRKIVKTPARITDNPTEIHQPVLYPEWGYLNYIDS